MEKVTFTAVVVCGSLVRLRYSAAEPGGPDDMVNEQASASHRHGQDLGGKEAHILAQLTDLSPGVPRVHVTRTRTALQR